MKNKTVFLIFVVLLLLAMLPLSFTLSPFPLVFGWLPSPLLYWWILMTVNLIFVLYVAKKFTQKEDDEWN